MSNYRYTAFNKAKKRLTGVINAPSIEDARKELEKLDLNILTLDLADLSADRKLSKEVTVFEFVAISETNKKITGTIPARSRFHAFKRLTKEYHFDVQYLCDKTKTARQKKLNREKGVEDLRIQLEKEMTEDIAYTPISLVTKKAQHKRLLLQTDYILSKMKEFMLEHEKGLKDRSKHEIVKLSKQLIEAQKRGDFDTIELTGRQLLGHLQKEELAVKKSTKGTDKKKLQDKTKSLINDLNKATTNRNHLTFSQKIASWEAKLGNRENLTLAEQIGVFFGDLYLKFFRDDDHIAEYKNQLSIINEQLWSYRKIWLTGPKTKRAETEQILFKLKDEKRRIEAKIKERNYEINKQKKEKVRGIKLPKREHAEKTTYTPAPILYDINSFLGWLLGFWLIYYIIGYYALTKKIIYLKDISWDFALFDSTFTTYSLLFLFIFYIFGKVHLLFFKRSTIAGIITFIIAVMMFVGTILYF